MLWFRKNVVIIFLIGSLWISQVIISIQISWSVLSMHARNHMSNPNFLCTCVTVQVVFVDAIWKMTQAWPRSANVSLSPPLKPRELLVQSLHVPHTVHVSSTVSLYLSPFKCNIFTETEFSWKLSSSTSALLFDPCFLFCFSFTLGDSFSGNICS